VRFLAVVALALLAGCAVLPNPGPADVQGRTDGYDPTASYLKVVVRDNQTGNSTLVDFDRKDWAVSEIAKRIDDKAVPFLSIHGQSRDVLGEVLVQDVRAPGDLAQLSYQNMHATAQQRALYDQAYDALLSRVAAQAPSPAGQAPGVTLPVPHTS